MVCKYRSLNRDSRLGLRGCCRLGTRPRYALVDRPDQARQILSRYAIVADLCGHDLSRQFEVKLIGHVQPPTIGSL